MHYFLTHAVYVLFLQTPCYVTGVISGDPHYTTWDGKKFDFMGKCSYYVIKGRDFSVEASHEVFYNGKFIVSSLIYKFPMY